MVAGGKQKIGICISEGKIDSIEFIFLIVA